jgi:hypothetical protein
VILVQSKWRGVRARRAREALAVEKRAVSDHNNTSMHASRTFLIGHSFIVIIYPEGKSLHFHRCYPSAGLPQHQLMPRWL